MEHLTSHSVYAQIFLTILYRVKKNGRRGRVNGSLYSDWLYSLIEVKPWSQDWLIAAGALSLSRFL